MAASTTATTTTPSTMLLSPQQPPRDLSHLRALVPVATHRDASSGQAHTYLNASFQPPMNLIVRSAIQSFLDEATFSPHPKPTWQSRAEDLRALLATYLHAPSASTIALTRDTTEGLNLIQRSLALQPGDNVLILDSEHPNQACGWLALRDTIPGLEIRQIPTTGTAHDFHATAATFAPYVDARTRAVGLSSCMFHSGQRNDVAGISAAFRPRGIHVLADLTQEVGFGAVDVGALGVSAAAFGLHKGLGCPTGLGALYVDPAVLGELKGTPPIVGAGGVANLRADLTVSAVEGLVYHGSARRFEHLNVSLIAVHAARAALRFLLYDVGVEELEAHLRALGRRLREGAGRLRVPVVGEVEEEKRAPQATVLALRDERWMELLERERIRVSAYRLGVRVSVGFYNNEADIDRLLEVLEIGKAAGIPLC
ncbi:Aminotransferase class-V [Lasiodiplodia theobromae]|uniref:Aminotransferase class-V n=1 Tax=Lasiodiplodia theobromae TaxID=45133 RepID=UPI0015C38BB6|nr:Aminotransferase class-V [Lasiodiplodia theobromae]KAF4535215.1 Aminotransferase class-V [Lasiodiplodia theobromae]